LAIRKLVNVDNYMEELFNKVDNKKLNNALTDLRDAINILN
jgi:hypothetical protein